MCLLDERTVQNVFLLPSWPELMKLVLWAFCFSHSRYPPAFSQKEHSITQSAVVAPVRVKPKGLDTREAGGVGLGVGRRRAA